MAVTTNVPAVAFGPTGFTVPTQAQILAGVQADINTAFGGGLNQSLSTPQGQLASSLTALIAQANDTFVEITNQTNPNFAGGVWQDAIAQLYFLQREPSEPTVVQATCSGQGVTIPVGALAQAEDGNIYSCTQAGALPQNGGTIVLPFACTIPGPITCAAGTLNIIYQVIPGWDSIVNLTDGVIGNDTESTADFAARMAASVGINSVGSLPSVLGAVLDVTGVLDAYVTENDSSSPATIGGVTLVPNSLYVAVVGGSESDVATAIWSKKAPGCNYNGNTTVVVQDSRSGYSPPFPSYNVTFEIPASLPILYSVKIANNPQVPSNATTLIQNAIIAAFSGADGGTRARIGSTIYASRYYAAIAALGPWAQIVLLQVGSSNTPSAVFVGFIAGNALTILSTTSGTIAIGQTLYDAFGVILPGTTITAGSGSSWTISTTTTLGASFTGTGSGTNLTASAVTGVIAVGQTIVGTGVPANTTIVSGPAGGGAGVYVTSNATTSVAAALHAGETIIGALANNNSVVVNINQVPTVNANNITVALL